MQTQLKNGSIVDIIFKKTFSLKPIFKVKMNKYFHFSFESRLDRVIN